MTLKFLQDVQNAVTSPYRSIGNSVTHLAKDTRHGISKGANTLVGWGKGVTKGTYSLAKDVTGGFKQLTSPVGMIAVAVIVVGVIILVQKK